MKIKITTYIDNEKLVEENYIGLLEEQKIVDKINYFDENKNKIEIIIDKIKESVSIEKNEFKIPLEYSRKKFNYISSYGSIKMESQLLKLKKQAKNKFVSFEIEYNLFFSDNDKQKNKLKLLIVK